MVQVGKFYDGPEILYQDTFDGSLISIADKIIDIIYLKYLKAKLHLSMIGGMKYILLHVMQLEKPYLMQLFTIAIDLELLFRSALMTNK